MTEDDPEPKRVIDVNEIRDPSILAHGLDRADRAYWLYYDETQNIRRLHLERGTLNIAAPDCWVLGGVGRPDDTPIDLAPLRQRARIQASAEELKFHLFGQKGGDLLDALAKPKMETFLDWVIEQDLLVHYLALDPFYWAIVDIIDSALPDDPGMLVMAIPQLKSDLFRLLRSDRDRAASLMVRFNYPDIAPQNRAPFMTALIDWLSEAEEAFDHFDYQMLRGVLQMGRRKPLTFIEGETPHVLIDGFRTFFIERICLLKNARHVFDQEDVVAAELAKMEFEDDGFQFCNHRFAPRSHDEPGVQASDIMASLIGRLFSWAAGVDDEDVMETRAALTPLQERSRQRLSTLIRASRAENDALTNAVVSLEDQRKIAGFLDL
ncbi:MAG: hypothetical protein DI624_00515 [Brevundimonas sp.]|uniref:hypothetical protein n=1 Tax=Brevundimonas sp. TaxID=1871086 RepID=UPI000DB0711F|nr:hypothetical protein [Brevundimonas sp.]PZU01492.1 MAG: hypothetical protein DI624_00515 [Brevundimonas sp.]